MKLDLDGLKNLALFDFVISLLQSFISLLNLASADSSRLLPESMDWSEVTRAGTKILFASRICLLKLSFQAFIYF